MQNSLMRYAYQYLRSTCNILNLQDFVGQISVAHQALRKRTCQQSE
ncbi:hypothetical protein AC35_1275 [Escherichia coli 3-475-03_S3_C2]|nr:hypothetical protein ECDEC10D_1081 [Escherichia coli DEC10D]EKJ61311.1 hypothetical protein EC01288_0793 [Escherichia coli 0.1288]KDZ43541.1 hypothetical protein AD13_2290 [Escherichia coli 3-020-07_S4_C2]KDZ50529.1 hypothetical protein AD41_2586 [Escherichia coli 3-020-07_S4_C3]KEK84810.1 hypothetical protein AB48_0441 [Escherichia coli 3-475-03_S1_C2]KEK88611.1 hypothetical protein AC35_1275 [Escherichia coli 3-475-03_S3_C2]